MKHQILLFSLYVLSFSLYGQSLDWEHVFDDNIYEKVNDALIIGDKAYVAGASNICNSSGWFRCVSTTGEEVFKESQWWGIDGIQEIIHLSDSVIVGVTCETGSEIVDENAQRPRVVGWNLDGNTLFDIYPIDVMSHFPNNDLKVSICPTDQQPMAIAYQNTILLLDEMGQMLDSIPFTINGAFQQIIRLDSQYLLAHSQHDVLLLDHNAQIIHQFPSGGEILDAHGMGDKAYFLRESDILVYDTQLQDTSSYDAYLSSITAAEGITGNSESLFLYELNMSDAAETILELDKEDLSVIESFAFDASRTRLGNIVADDTRLIMMGQGQSIGGFIKTKELDAPLTYKGMDISLYDLEVQGETYVVDSFFPPSAPPIYTYNFRMYLDYTITNNGLDTLESFSIHSQYFGHVFCNAGIRKITYSGLSLPPGESMILNDSMGMGSPEHYSPPSTLQLTAYAPNHLLDMDFLNNEITADVVLVSSKEVIPSLAEWHFYPNPAQFVLHLDIQREDTSIPLRYQIRNSLGQLMQEGIIPDGQAVRHSIPLEDLPSGHYWLSLTDGKAMEGRGFVVLE